MAIRSMGSTRRVRAGVLRVVGVAVLLLAGPAARAVESEDVAERLAGALRYPTVSPADPADFDGRPFVGLAGHLAASYPRVHAALDVERVADYSLLFRWRGTRPELEPVLFMSHLDVVPVDDRTRSEWTHPPFAGVVADGYVWGRGALDVKSGVVVWLEAIEALLAEGLVPERDVYLSFGHDEEIGGRAGAAAVAGTLEERGVRISMLFDEGGHVALDDPLVPGRPVATVLVAEKTYMNIRLVARGQGGHSSRPPLESAVDRLARAIHRLHENPMPARLTPPIRAMLEAAAPYQSFAPRTRMRHLWLFEGLVLREMLADPQRVPLVRSTMATTVVRAGVKANVVPEAAEAIVNLRLLPGDSQDDAVAHVRGVIDDPNVDLEVIRFSPSPPPASLDGEGLELIRASVRAIHPDAVVLPSLMTGATDTRRFTRIVRDAYRFVPIEVSREVAKTKHARDERIAVEPLARAVAIAREMVLRAARPAWQGGP